MLDKIVAAFKGRNGRHNGANPPLWFSRLEDHHAQVILRLDKIAGNLERLHDYMKDRDELYRDLHKTG